MIALAWRQQRVALLALTVYLVALVALMAYHRFTMLDVAAERGLLPCVTSREDPACGPVDTTVWDWYTVTENVRLALLGYGALAGVFLGAPLFAREWEQHTHLLALSQATPPTRWYTAKVVVVFVPAAVGALVLGGVYRWWTTALGGLLTPREGFHAGLFEPQPLALFGYVVFGVGLGVVVGLVIRRVVPSMAVTLAGWLAAVYVVRRFARPHYAAPAVSGKSYDDPHSGYHADPGRWRIDEGFVDASGRFRDAREPEVRDAVQHCYATAGGPAGKDFPACMDSRGLESAADLVQPGDRFWWFQVIEMALFTAAGGLCLLAAGWWLRKRFRRGVLVPVTGA